ncbi:MAG: GTP-binding protein [Phycisphaerales bacterium]|nr:MAG: GTP-binding protein [Phycisphaerales bacterium]
MAAQATILTARAPGAIAILQMHGECEHDVLAPLVKLTARDDWPLGRLRLAPFADIDEGLAARLTPTLVHLMPHGGPRVVQRLLEWLAAQGVRIVRSEAIEARTLYPEAETEREAEALRALAQAASPAAIDPLLAQSALTFNSQDVTGEDRARSARLNRLIHPPLVVLAGPPNVGKSTLSNALVGRSMSIALDQPGTTRDYTAAMIELRGLVVRWHDTPGLHETNDPIEARAIALSKRLMQEADLLIAMTDSDHDWPALPRSPDLRIANKADLRRRDDADAHLAALAGEGVPELVRRIRDALIHPGDEAAAFRRPWHFESAITSAPAR